MIKAFAALTISLAMTAGATGAECRFENAIYTQSSGGWTLRFHPLQHHGPANKTAEFDFELDAGVTLTGSVYWPNGYSTPIYTIEGPCESGSTEQPCSFLEGENPTVYVLTDKGIERMPENLQGPAPRQVLLPRLRSAIWYSSYRQSEFEMEVDPGEVFSLSGCETS